MGRRKTPAPPSAAAAEPRNRSRRVRPSVAGVATPPARRGTAGSPGSRGCGRPRRGSGRAEPHGAEPGSGARAHGRGGARPRRLSISPPRDPPWVQEGGKSNCAGRKCHSQHLSSEGILVDLRSRRWASRRAKVTVCRLSWRSDVVGASVATTTSVSRAAHRARPRLGQGRVVALSGYGIGGDRLARIRRDRARGR